MKSQFSIEISETPKFLLTKISEVLKHKMFGTPKSKISEATECGNYSLQE